MLSKFKSLIGYNNENDKKEVHTESRKEATIDTKKETEIRRCDCCNEQDIIIETSEMFKVNDDGEKMPIFTHPKVNLRNGGIYDDVAICNNCFSTCETDTQKQYVWIFGKINGIHKEILTKEEAVIRNNDKIAEIKAKAEAEIRKIAEENNELASEMNSLQNTIELYEQEQRQIESSL